MQNLFVIIQARMTSTRLPGKVLMPLGNSTVLEVMLKRLSVFRENIIIATTDDKSAEPIIDICQSDNIRYFRGSTDDVLSRYYHAAQKFNAQANDVIVRCTSDCPFIDADIMQSTINKYREQNEDSIVQTGVVSGFPRGLDVEVFSFNSLRNAFLEAKARYDREHVTPYIKKTGNTILHHSDCDYSHYRLTLDVPEDYEVLKKVAALFNNQLDFNFRTLIEMLEKNPEITQLNKHVEQKKG